MMSWKEIEFKDFVTLQRGFDLTAANMKDGEVPVMGSSGVVGFHNEFKVNGPGVVTGRSGTLGFVQYTDQNYWPHNTSLWVKDFKGNDPRFVFYMLKILRLERFNGGASVPTLNRNVLDHLKLRVPSTSKKQEEISNALLKYDALIKINEKRVALLEESARLIYKEWFVNLRFPGHEKVKIIEGVPLGWSKSSLKELCERLDYGFTTSAVKDQVGPKFLRITDIVPSVIDWDSVPYCECPEDKIASYLLTEGDVVVARTGATTGFAKRIGKNPPETVFASYLVRMRFKDKISNYITGIFLESDSYKTFVRSNWGGAAQPGANAQILARPEILIPTKDIQTKFEDIAKPLFEMRENLIKQNSRLFVARDLLLPRLMNGDIEL